MCGIAGFISRRGKTDIQTALAKTLGMIKHRGPDHTGAHYTRNKAWDIGLGMNRLSILDISSSGNQPMFFENLIIIHNGEIFNFIEIKKKLVAKGHNFAGNTDTEVVLHAFKEWGPECVHEFNGMFAFVILDTANDTLYAYRDRTGEKPFYYYMDADSFLFASEMKGLLVHDFINKEMDVNGVFNYLIFSSASSPGTLLKNIKQIPPGAVMTLALSADSMRPNIKQYWDIPDLEPDHSLSEKIVLRDLSDLIADAVNIRLRSDVPLGIFLSGGIDSSLVAAIASEVSPNIRTYSIGYRDKNRDESRYAEFVAKHLKVEHTTLMLNEEMANLDFKDLAYISDDGVANISLIPYCHLVEQTRKHVTVALSGDGGDEFFCGYVNYDTMANLYNYRKVIRLFPSLLMFTPGLQAIRKIVTGSDDIDVFIAQYLLKDTLDHFGETFNVSPKPSLSKTISARKKAVENNKKITFRSLNYYMSSGSSLANYVLKTTDRVSMKSGLEVRPVFTDHRIIEYMAKVPDSLVLAQKTDKYLLRKLLSRYIPGDYAFKRPKMGFSVPLTTDYRSKWEEAVARSLALFKERKLSFFDMGTLEMALADNSKYSGSLKARFVFLAHFIELWNLK